MSVLNRELVSSIAQDVMSNSGYKNPRDVSRIVNMHYTTIYAILRGDPISRGSLIKFCKNLQAEDRISEILNAAGYEPEVPRYDPIKAISFALNNTGISEEGKKEVLNFVEEMIEKYGKDK